MSRFTDPQAVGRFDLDGIIPALKNVFGDLPKFSERRPVTLDVQLGIATSSVVTEEKDGAFFFHFSVLPSMFSDEFDCGKVFGSEKNHTIKGLILTG